MSIIFPVCWTQKKKLWRLLMWEFLSVKWVNGEWATKKNEGMSLRKHLDLGRQIFAFQTNGSPREISARSIQQTTTNGLFLEGNSCTRKRNIFMIKVCCLVICLSFPSLPSAKGGGTLNYPLTESHSLFVHPIIYTYFSLFSFLPFLLFLQYTWMC